MGAAGILNVDQCKQRLVRDLIPSGLRMVLFSLASVLTVLESCVLHAAGDACVGSRNLLSVHHMPITILGAQHTLLCGLFLVTTLSG